MASIRSNPSPRPGTGKGKGSNGGKRVSGGRVLPNKTQARRATSY